jgi:predicted membrane protein
MDYSNLAIVLLFVVVVLMGFVVISVWVLIGFYLIGHKNIKAIKEAIEKEE